MTDDRRRWANRLAELAKLRPRGAASGGAESQQSLGAALARHGLAPDADEDALFAAIPDGVTCAVHRTPGPGAGARVLLHPAGRPYVMADGDTVRDALAQALVRLLEERRNQSPG